MNFVSLKKVSFQDGRYLKKKFSGNILIHELKFDAAKRFAGAGCAVRALSGWRRMHLRGQGSVGHVRHLLLIAHQAFQAKVLQLDFDENKGFQGVQVIIPHRGKSFPKLYNSVIIQIFIQYPLTWTSFSQSFLSLA